ncbi:hypothetical protein WDV91_09765 [Curtobacterium flaccumfaciens pv. flaccumfaciens]
MVARSASTSPSTNDQLWAPGVGSANVYVVVEAPVVGESTFGRWFM